MADDRDLMPLFAYDHLPLSQRIVGQTFYELAKRVETTLPENTERTVCLFKLLEAKNAAARALLPP